MCGIAGVIHRDGDPVSQEGLERMMHRLSHRGPDGRGWEIFDGVGLAHTRLRIIDLSERGRQPMANEDESIWVVFNGEIWDYREHRAQLQRAGHVFRSETDTEVLLHLYEEEGMKGLARLNGMFAYAIYDRPRARMVLARDRTGEKPLFVYEKGRRIAFASEIKALLAYPGVDASRDPAAIPSYLAHGYVPNPGTFFEYITKVEPGCSMVIEANGPPSSRRYWSYPRTMSDGPDLEEAAGRVRTIVDRAVQRRLIADVPVGAFLSGGVDSSIVVASMVRQSAKVRTFSLGYHEASALDESAVARRVAEVLGTEHTELRIGPGAWESVADLLETWDEPFGDSSALATYLLAKEARKHVSVVLTGDGGDEVFGGYPRFASVAYAEAAPEPLRRAIGHLGRRLFELAPLGSPWDQARRFVERLPLPLPERLHSWIAVFRPEQLKTLYRLEIPPAMSPPYRNLLEGETWEDAINLVLRINARSYLSEDLNVKVDRATMSQGLESRAPFLDAELLDYAFSLPGSFKISWGRRKWILRQAFRDAVPGWVFARPKMGFSVPLADWFRGPLRELLMDRLVRPDARVGEWIDLSVVAQVVQEHLSRSRDRSHQLWSLLMLESWLGRK